MERTSKKSPLIKKIDRNIGKSKSPSVFTNSKSVFSDRKTTTKSINSTISSISNITSTTQAITSNSQNSGHKVKSQNSESNLRKNILKFNMINASNSPKESYSPKSINFNYHRSSSPKDLEKQLMLFTNNQINRSLGSTTSKINWELPDSKSLDNYSSAPSMRRPKTFSSPTEVTSTTTKTNPTISITDYKNSSFISTTEICKNNTTSSLQKDYMFEPEFLKKFTPLVVKIRILLSSKVSKDGEPLIWSEKLISENNFYANTLSNDDTLEAIIDKELETDKELSSYCNKVHGFGQMSQRQQRMTVKRLLSRSIED